MRKFGRTRAESASCVVQNLHTPTQPDKQGITAPTTTAPATSAPATNTSDRKFVIINIDEHFPPMSESSAKQLPDSMLKVHDGKRRLPPHPQDMAPPPPPDWSPQVPDWFQQAPPLPRETPPAPPAPPAPQGLYPLSKEIYCKPPPPGLSPLSKVVPCKPPPPGFAANFQNLPMKSPPAKSPPVKFSPAESLPAKFSPAKFPPAKSPPAESPPAASAESCQFFKMITKRIATLSEIIGARNKEMVSKAAEPCFEAVMYAKDIAGYANMCIDLIGKSMNCECRHLKVG